MLTLMSAAVYGGVSQMVGIELFGQHVAPWLTVLSIFTKLSPCALFRRHRPAHLALPDRALWDIIPIPTRNMPFQERKAETGQAVSFIWYLGLLPAGLCVWVIETALGAYFGKLINSNTPLTRHRFPAAYLFLRPHAATLRLPVVAVAPYDSRRATARPPVRFPPAVVGVRLR